jgi:RNA polymerase sigma-70 factor (ECF subfamily)
MAERGRADLDLIFRREAGRLVPFLLRRLGPRHFDLAEEAVQDAFVEALRHWPVRGRPDDPRAWLLRTAHRKALDRLRRAATALGRAAPLDDALPAGQAAYPEQPALPDEVAVLLLACDPALPREGRVALTLRTVGGLTTAEIAQALLVAEAAVAQRIVRAKRELARRGLTPLPAVPSVGWDERISSALEVIYLVFTEGHHATRGAHLVRDELMTDAAHLAGLLAACPLTASPSVHALAALIHFGLARAGARLDEQGELALPGERDRGRWDARHLTAAWRHFEASASGALVSRYHVEAALAAAHSRPDTPTDWPRVLALYDDLVARWPSPVARLNRAVAVLHVEGAPAARAALAPVLLDPALASYAPAWITAAEVAARLGEVVQAQELFRRALRCAGSEPQQRSIERRMQDLARRAPPG